MNRNNAQSLDLLLHELLIVCRITWSDPASILDDLPLRSLGSRYESDLPSISSATIIFLRPTHPAAALNVFTMNVGTFVIAPECNVQVLAQLPTDPVSFGDELNLGEVCKII